jgi:acyl dehydratase
VSRVKVSNVEDVRRLLGTPIGPSEWREISQEAVDDFSRLSGDDQWIHTDPERARRESPFGGPVAHGNLTLAMIDGLRAELIDWSAFELDINYGWNKVRFPAPVPVGARVRASLELLSIDGVSVGWRILQRITVEVEGGPRPACVAESLDILVPSRAPEALALGRPVRAAAA